MTDPAALAPDQAVLAADGPLGRVESVVVSPRTGQVARLVVELAGRSARFVVVPTEWVARLADGFVWLDRPLAAAQTLPVQRRNAEGWLQPARHDPAPEPFTPGDDAELAEAARRLLAADSLTADGAVEVTVQHGVANLRGRVRSAAGAYQARRLALGVPGIWHVRLDLVSDEALVVEVRRRLSLAPGLAAEPVQIEADLGQVTLRTRPLDPPRAALAEEVALAVPGVRSVRLASPPPSTR